MATKGFAPKKDTSIKSRDTCDLIRLLEALKNQNYAAAVKLKEEVLVELERRAVKEKGVV